MDVLMLDGWTPILFFGLIIAGLIFFISRKISRKSLLLTSTTLSVICVGMIIYSIIGVGGWEGMGLGFVTITAFLGIWVGTGIGVIINSKKKINIHRTKNK